MGDFSYIVVEDLQFKSGKCRFRISSNNEQRRVLSAEEESLYLLAASQPLQDVALLMLETGMRPDEVLRINRTNLHLAPRRTSKA